MTGKEESRNNNKELLLKALVEIKKARARIEELESQAHAPIAIIGMGCRYPGSVDHSAAYWEMLRNGVDGITQLQNERWPIGEFYDPDIEQSGKLYTAGMGVIDDVQHFDAELFGISPLEAKHMDPQHRVLMETTYQALENAGQAPDSLKGSKTGVFVGICHSDYSHLQACFGGLDAITPYDGIGNAHAIASGRISYQLGLQGPCMSLDTACSSSLLAVHLAVQSLRLGESNMAIAGGINVIYNPSTSIAFCKARMLSPQGKCKTFDAGADGYVRSEGSGIVILKRLADAQRDGDNIIAVVRGSAVNQDGKSQGITAPNELQQEQVIRAALSNARMKPDDIDFIEAHGTGTALGDPIEVGALGAIFGKVKTAQNPLLIGSSKTNIGHMEAAAGIGGMMKLALALQHEAIPPHIHFSNPNPHIPWNELPIAVTSKLTSWKRSATRKRAGGVSSFGFSGTNVHIVLEEAPLNVGKKVKDQLPPPTQQVVNFSGRTKAALDANIREVADFLHSSPGVNLANLAHTTRTGRAQLDERMSLSATTVAALSAQLQAYAADPGNFKGSKNSSPKQTPRIAFLFSGQGSQYAGISKELYENQPHFAAALDKVAAVMTQYLDKPLLSILWGDNTRFISDTQYTQPALFAVEYALAEMWKAWGIRPNVVMGHSVGEYAAACYAGVFSMEDAAKLIAARGRLMTSLCKRGDMIALLATRDDVETLIQPFGSCASIAAINGPTNIVVSGDSATIADILATAAARQIKATRLDTSHAFHSAMMAPMLDEFATIAATISYKRPHLGLISNLNGEIARADIATSAYWVRHVREPVHFAQGMETLSAQKIGIFLEIGPGTTLLGMGRHCVEDIAAIWAPSLRQGRADSEQIAQTLSDIWCAGAAVDWRAFDQPYQYQRIEAPTYCFQRKVFWLESLPQLVGAGDPPISWFEKAGARGATTSTREAAHTQTNAPLPTASDSGGWLAITPPDEREARLVEAIRTEVGRAIYQDAADIDPELPFVSLGLDSLMVMDMRSKLQAALGAAIPASLFIEYPNAATLASGLLQWWQDIQADPGKRLPRIEALPRDETLPLSYSQEQLWFLNELMPASSAYNVAIETHIRGTLDHSIVARSIEFIVARHEILRTSFRNENGIARAVIAESLPISLPMNDVSSEDDVAAWAARDAGTPFDLGVAPLFRVRLLRVDSQHHVLLTTMHHIVTDGWSFGVLLRDLSLAYGAFERGEQVSLPALGIQYADYAAWQRRWLTADVVQPMLAYWEEELAGVMPLELNTDRPRPRTPSFNGRRLRFDLGTERAAALRAFSEAEQVTLFIPLLAAFSVVLQRDSGQDDFVVGTMSANRGQQEIENLIGLFVNALPLRVCLDGDPTVRDLLARLQERVQGAMAHQQTPFDLIVNAVQRDRDGARNPLFQVQLLLQADATPPPFADRHIDIREIDTQTAKRDLTVTIFNDAALTGHIEYSADLFDAPRIELLLQRLQIVLDAVVGNANQSLSALPFLTDVERTLQGQLPDESASQPAMSAATIAELFERVADQKPDAIAIRSSDNTFSYRELTYRELDQRANQLAYRLRQQGVGPNVPVALRVARTVDIAIGMLGIFKAGGIYVPIDGSYPADRIRYMLDDAKVQLIVTHADIDEALIQPSNRLPPANSADDPAYIIYTSGSTGHPKGVMVSHAGAAEYAECLYANLGIAGDDICLHTASISFSSSIRQMLVPLAAGATIVVASDEQRRDPIALMQLVQDCDITVIDLVPTMLRQIVNALTTLPIAQLAALRHNRLRLLLTASEPLRVALVREWRALVGDDVQWINMFGQTETTGIVSLHPVVTQRGDDQHIVPIGRPRMGVQLLVLDAQLRPVPLGVAGQLYVAGNALALAYIGDAALTASRFVANPQTGHERLYATGDIVRLGWDGNIEFIGRNDLQVKVRGFRVELGEIERVLHEHPDVREAAVVAFDEAGDKRLVAFVTVKNPAVSIQTLRLHMSQALPAHMLPSDFVTLETLPLTPTGKLNRSALVKPERTGQTAEAIDFIEPRAGIESALAQLWQQLLQVERVGAGDNFFYLGGNSLLAVQLRARIQAALYIDVPLSVIFEDQTLATQASRLETCAASPVSSSQLVRVERSGRQPLSMAQQINWAAERALPGAAAHWIEVALRIRGPLDIERKIDAVNEAFRRHDILRTVFHETDGEPTQEILDLYIPRVEVLHGGNAPVLPENHGSLFTGCPPVSVHLVRHGEDDHLFTLRCHRLLADGATVRQLLGEIGALYANGVTGSARFPLLGNTLQYSDYSAWESNWLTPALRQEHVDFFRRIYADGTAITPVPADASSAVLKPKIVTHAARQHFTLSNTAVSAVHATATRERASLPMVLTALYASVLGRYCGLPFVTIAMPVSRRHHAATHQMPGPFMNTLLLRIEVADDPSLPALTARVRETLLAAMSRQDAPFHDVMAALIDDHGAVAAGLGEVALVMEDAAPLDGSFAGLALSRESSGAITARRALTLSIATAHGAISGTATYDSDVFTAGTIQSMLNAFTELASAQERSPRHDVSLSI